MALGALALQARRWELWYFGYKKISRRVGAHLGMGEHLAALFAC